jgi:putative thiamine transport system permease protein
MLRFFVPLISLICFLPLFFGMAGVLLPAFGFNPAVQQAPLGMDAIALVLAEPGILKSLGLTLFTGIGATLVSLLFCFLIASFCWQTRWWSVIRTALTPILSLPHVAFAIGFVFLFAPSGWLMRFFTPWLTGWQAPPDWQIIQDPLGLSLTIAMVMKETPFLILMSMAAFSQIDIHQQLRIARSLGYRPHQVWFKLLLPQLYPLIRLPVLAVLVYSLAVVDMALLLGPNRPPTLAVQVFHWFREPDLTLLTRAAAGAFVLLAATLLCIFVCILAEKLFMLGMRYRLVNGHRGRRVRFSAMAAKCLAPMGMVVSLTILASLGLWSIAHRWRFPGILPTQWSFVLWRTEAPYTGQPIWNTVLLAALASITALALVIGALEYQRASGKRWPLAIIALPILLPQLPMLFGIQTAVVWAGWDTIFWIVLWGHILFVFPYLYLCLYGNYLQYDQRYIQAALSMGTGALKSWWRIKLPMLIRPVLFSWAVGFSVSIAQYLPTLMLGGGRISTITTEAVAIGSGGDRQLAAIYALIQLGLPAMAYLFALAYPRLRYFRRGSLHAASA